MRLTLRMELLSDTCFAAGASGLAGDADTEVDADSRTGLPNLSGRTVKGLLVEELAIILKALEPAGGGPWHDEAARLFGTPQAYALPGKLGEDLATGMLSFGDGGASPSVASWVRRSVADGSMTPHEVFAALTTLRRQTAIDHKTGAPLTGSLRGTRLWRAGMELACPVDVRGCLGDGKALLAASTLALRRVGLHRNEGWGRVRVRILDHSSQDVTSVWVVGLARDVNDCSSGATPRPIGPIEERAGDPPVPAPSRAVVRYTLRLRRPLLLTTRGGDPNAVETLPYVSGAAILGALGARWLASNPTQDPAGSEPFRRLFVDGRTRFLNAYPANRSGERLVPAPRTLRVPKREAKPGKARDISVRPAGAREELRAVGEGTFVRWVRGDDETKLELATVRTSARLHHQREREAGRSTDGTMFTYVSIDPGQRFAGCVLCNDARDAEVLRALLANGPLSLGRSRGAGYGGDLEVESLEVIPVATPTCTSFLEGAGEPSDEDEDLVLTLVSDYLGRSESGIADPAALIGEIGERLGLGRVLLDRAELYLGYRDVSGHVAPWRMPRPTHPAIAAGSVVILPGGKTSEAALAALLWEGIGERRAEGFGRVALGLRAEAEISIEAVQETPVGEALQPDDPMVTRLCRNIVRDRLRNVLIVHAEALARTLFPPSASLCARLRGRVRTAQSEREVLDLIDAMSLKKAGQSLERTRVYDKSLRQQLRVWLTPLRVGEGDLSHGLFGEHVVERELGRWPLTLDVLSDDDRWYLIQAFLDAFFDRLRREAADRREQEAAR